jgi:phosphoglucosamine mutase
MDRAPQVLENVRVERKDWEQNAAVKEVINAAEARLHGEGRIFVRASGTEPLIRVMAEGPDEAELRRIVREVAGVIKAELGR